MSYGTPERHADHQKGQCRRTMLVPSAVYTRHPPCSAEGCEDTRNRGSHRRAVPGYAGGRTRTRTRTGWVHGVGLGLGIGVGSLGPGLFFLVQAYRLSGVRAQVQQLGGTIMKTTDP